MTTPTGTIERISREEFETKRPKRYGGALPSPETKEFLKLAVDGAMKAHCRWRHTRNGICPGSGLLTSYARRHGMKARTFHANGLLYVLRVS